VHVAVAVAPETQVADLAGVVDHGHLVLRDVAQEGLFGGVVGSHGAISVNAPHASTWYGDGMTRARDSAGAGSMARSCSNTSGDGRQVQAEVIGCDWLSGW
jgi:hypothetical protein